MDYNAHMNYEHLAHKSILLLGKTRSLAHAEFETLLSIHSIELKTSWDDNVAMIVEGRMMNPFEQEESARLYEERGMKSVQINEIEKWLCQSIEPNRLLMSLKLSRNQERLVDFIKNPYITDELFYKLLKLYDWRGEGLFDNDSNRDVTAAIIGRFYLDIERNHNVQYAMSGLAHLIEKYGTRELINAIAELSPIAKEIQNPHDRSLSGVLDAISLHTESDEKILAKMISQRAHLIARREPLALEEELLALEDESINLILAQNPTLSLYGIDRLESSYPECIASYHTLDKQRFEKLLKSYAASLARNSHLTLQMQEQLMALQNDEVNENLSRNSVIKHHYLEELFMSNCYDAALASNTSLQHELLEKLYMRGKSDVLKALAANTSTPIEILYQLSLDQRFERIVKTNESFGHHIQTTNLGWN